MTRLGTEVRGSRIDRRVWWMFYAGAGLVVAFVVSLIVRRSGSYWMPVDGWGVAAFELSMGGLCLGRYFDPKWRSSSSIARALPLVLGAACIAWALGDLALTVESLGGATPSVPSVADALYLGFFPLCFIAFVLVVRRGITGSVVATSLDGIIAGLGVAAVSGAYAFSTVLRVTGGSALSTATSMAYPLGDVLLLALAIGGLAILPKEYRRFLVIASVALTANAIGDGFNLLQPNSRLGYISNAAAWPVALLLLALAAWVQPTNANVRTADAELAAEKTAGFALPILGSVASLAVLVSASLGYAERAAVGLATATLFVVGVRLALTIREAHARNSSRFRSLIDNLSDLIVVTEADFQVAYITPSSRRVLDYTPTDLQGHLITDLVHPDDTDTILGHLGQHAAETVPAKTVETAMFETRVRHHNGTWRTIAWTATNLLDDPSVRGYVLNGTDVTDARRASEDLAAARDAAMEATRMKSEFLASMSHEIRTPMNAVIGLSELLLGTTLDREQREYATGVNSAGEGLLAIINDILDFSKIEAGKLELEIIDFEPSLLLEDVAALLGEAANRKHVELLAHPYPELPAVVQGDPTRLRQVLVNLASNAVKFTADGEVVIRAMPVSDDGDRTVVRFEIADTGIGIAPEDQRRMFEPFSQADASTTRRFGGTGLGLAIVRQLVELMGGHLGLDSEVDRGSTFWFELPFEHPHTEQISTPTVPEFGSLHAIVVDDNATNRLILRQQLGSWGICPDEAEDALGALAQIHTAATQGWAYDFAILDLNMPGMDGLELAHAIKADPATASAKLFLLSSSGRVSNDVADAAELSGTLAKPVRQSELFNCLIEGLHMEPSPTNATNPTPLIRDADAGDRGVVLLVEDNTMNQLVATRMLAKLGYRTDVANNGREAIDAITVGAYDAVLMDCQMPEMDGYEATRQLRRAEAGTDRHLPVIAMTAAAMQGDRETCLDAGMDDYITKPVRPDAIDQALQRWIIPKHADRGPAASRQEVERPVLDPERFAMLRDLDAGDGDLLETIVREYLTDANRLLAAIGEAIAEGDPQTVERNSHTLKGSSANLGAIGLTEICGKLEALGRAAALGTATRLLDEAAAEFDRVRTALTLEVSAT